MILSLSTQLGVMFSVGMAQSCSFSHGLFAGKFVIGFGERLWRLAVGNVDGLAEAIQRSGSVIRDIANPLRWPLGVIHFRLEAIAKYGGELVDEDCGVGAEPDFQLPPLRLTPRAVDLVLASPVGEDGCLELPVAFLVEIDRKS